MSKMSLKLCVTLLMVLYTVNASPVPRHTAMDYRGLEQLLREELRHMASEQNLELEIDDDLVEAPNKQFEGDIVLGDDDLLELQDWQAEDEALEDPDLFEGDIVLEDDDLLELQQNWKASEQGAPERAEKKRWPNGTVSYEFHESVTDDLKEYILKAIKEYEEKTCLRFREAVEGDRLLFTKEGKGCSSRVGRIEGAQKVILSKCKQHGVILHEIGHAVGFWHEQSRQDRDRFVRILWDNINDDNEANFKLVKSVDYHDEVYDYGSVMHYSKKAFAINRRLDTIEVTDKKVYEQQGYPRLGGAKHLSPIDVREINKMYKCFNPHGQEGTLVVTMLRAGTFQRAAPKQACVKAFNSAGESMEKCTQYSTKDHTDPVWDEELTFKSKGDSGWRYFEIRLKYKNFRSILVTLLHKQTIWVDGIHRESSYCVQRAKGCVEYEYRVEKRFRG